MSASFSIRDTIFVNDLGRDGVVSERDPPGGFVEGGGVVSRPSGIGNRVPLQKSEIIKNTIRLILSEHLSIVYGKSHFDYL